MKTFFRWVVLAFLLNLLFSFPAFADVGSSLTSGTQWLLSQQNPDGSWGSNPDRALLETSTVVDTFKAINQSGAGYDNGVAWLNQQTPEAVDFNSRRIVSLIGAGIFVDSSVILTDYNNDGGWGGDSGFTSDLLDTALALSALKATGYSDQTVINNALNYLLANQNTDGGFGFYQGDDSNVYMTALTAITLQQFPQTTSLATALNKSKDYLLLHQNTDGGFGSSLSTVYETAYAFMALMGATTDATVLGKASSYPVKFYEPISRNSYIVKNVPRGTIL